MCVTHSVTYCGLSNTNKYVFSLKTLFCTEMHILLNIRIYFTTVACCQHDGLIVIYNNRFHWEVVLIQWICFPVAHNGWSYKYWCLKQTYHTPLEDPILNDGRGGGEVVFAKGGASDLHMGFVCICFGEVWGFWECRRSCFFCLLFVALFSPLVF